MAVSGDVASEMRWRLGAGLSRSKRRHCACLLRSRIEMERRYVHRGTSWGQLRTVLARINDYALYMDRKRRRSSRVRISLSASPAIVPLSHLVHGCVRSLSCSCLSPCSRQDTLIRAVHALPRTTVGSTSRNVVNHDVVLLLRCLTAWPPSCRAA